MRQRFPNNEDRRSFRIRRPLSKPSRRALWYCESLPDEFPDKGFRSLHAMTDLTIVGKMDVVDARRAVPRLGSMLFRDLANELLEPTPTSAEQTIISKVKKIGYIGTKRVVRAALFLEDETGAIESEYETYTGRLDGMGANGRWKGMIPHISIALIPKIYADNDVLGWIEGQAPEEVALLPVSTDPRIPSL